jgi:mRNA interferase RelE/StbE
MPFEIIWSISAIKELKKLNRLVSRRIYEAVGKLKEDPYHNIKKLTNSEYFRLRVGDYRIILDINEKQLRVLVIKVGHRNRIYK